MHGFNPRVGKISWSRKCQLVPVFLPGKFHGQRSLVGYSPWGCKDLDTAEHTDTKGKAKVNSLIWGPHVSDSLGPGA